MSSKQQTYWIEHSNILVFSFLFPLIGFFTAIYGVVHKIGKSVYYFVAGLIPLLIYLLAYVLHGSTTAAIATFIIQYAVLVAYIIVKRDSVDTDDNAQSCPLDFPLIIILYTISCAVVVSGVIMYFYFVK